MIRTLITMAVAGAAALVTMQFAQAQSVGNSESMQSLLREGFEIKAAAPNGNAFVVFLQKDDKAYACEFVTVTNSRCGEIN